MILDTFFLKYDGDGWGFKLTCTHKKYPDLLRVRTKNKFGLHRRLCENKDFCNAEILAFNQYQKYDKVPFIIYADIERIIERIDECKNNPEKSSTTKVSDHIPSGFLMCTLCSLRSTGNKRDLCRGKDCMKKLCESALEHAMKIIKFKKKKSQLYL